MDLQIKSIRQEQNSKTVAIYDLVVPVGEGKLCIHGIRLVESNEKRFILFPNKNINGLSKDIVHPLNSELREALLNKAVQLYEEYK